MSHCLIQMFAGRYVMALCGSAASFTILENTLKVSGEINMGDGQIFESAVASLLATDEKVLVIDLSQVKYMNSSCVRIVAEALVKAEKRQCRLTVRAKARVLRLFELVGIDRLGVFEEVEDD